MSLRHSYQQAAKILRRWPSASRPPLVHLCGQIQDSERELNAAAALRLAGCLEDCRGMCCRNLQLEAVFGIPDFVYILALEPLLDAGIGKRLRGKDSLYTSNCPFLEGGVGPCIFPPDVRPEVCITSFCRGDEPLKAEIRRIKIGFWKLGVLVGFRRIPLLHRLLVRAG
jgi:hypothetical protein